MATQPPPPPPASGIKPILWILGIVLGLLLIAGIAVIGTGLWVAHRIHNAVSVTTGPDGKSGIELHTKDGDIRLGAGTRARIPHWVPVYSGAHPTVNFSAEGEKGEGGSYSFRTDDTPDQVTAYYRTELTAEGMEITEQGTGVTGKNRKSNRAVSVMTSTDSGKTSVTVVFGENRE